MGRWAFVALVASVVGACGRGPSCTTDFMAGYHRVTFLAGGPYRRPDVDAALAEARAFRARYEGVRCVAQRTSATAEPMLVVINVNLEMDRLIARLLRKPSTNAF